MADETDATARELRAKDLLPLASFERQRARLQAEVLTQRMARAVRIGPGAMLIFENEATVRFRLQEILRHEAISDDLAVQAEIDTYSSLIPDGSNFKATFRFEFADAGERSARLAQLRGVENYVWMQVEGLPRVYAIADSDTDRGDADSDASLHYLRFELDEAAVRGMKQGGALSFGVDHPACTARELVGETVRRSLLQDLR